MSGTAARAELVVVTIDGGTYANVGVPEGATEALKANGWTVDGCWSYGGSKPDGWSMTATIREVAE